MVCGADHKKHTDPYICRAQPVGSLLITSISELSTQFYTKESGRQRGRMERGRKRDRDREAAKAEKMLSHDWAAFLLCTRVCRPRAKNQNYDYKSLKNVRNGPSTQRSSCTQYHFWNYILSPLRKREKHKNIIIRRFCHVPFDLAPSTNARTKRATRRMSHKVCSRAATRCIGQRQRHKIEMNARKDHET